VDGSLILSVRDGMPERKQSMRQPEMSKQPRLLSLRWKEFTVRG
jgi:hypothetical protein